MLLISVWCIDKLRDKVYVFIVRLLVARAISDVGSIILETGQGKLFDLMGKDLSDLRSTVQQSDLDTWWAAPDLLEIEVRYTFGYIAEL